MTHRETTEGLVIDESFRALTELAPDFVVLLGADGTINYVSPAVTRVLGHDVDEVRGQPFLDFVHPDDRTEAQNALRQVLQMDDVLMAQLRIRRKDGGWSVLETLGRDYTLIPTLRGILVSTRDITGHVDAERRYRTALEEAEDLYNNAPCGYHSFDADSVITRINDTELHWLGYTREELVGTKFRNLLTPGSQALFDRQFPLFKAGGRMANLEAELIRRDGSPLPVLLSATTVTVEAERFVAGRAILLDITERKHAEAALRRVNRALLLLGKVNQELIHAQSEPELLESLCRVMVVQGGYRWHHPERGRLGPGDFIGIAEHTGLITPLTYRVMDLALRQAALWSEQGFEIPVAVNVSVSNLADPEFANRVLQTLAAHNVRPDLLQIEITESIFMQEPERVEALLKRLTDPGVSIYIDDFGKGYSSLSYIAALPIRALKIDRAFVSGLLQSPRVHGIVAATISLAGSLGIRTVAEGVETKEQAQELINMRCDEIQGFFFARPAPPEEMHRWADAFEFASYGLYTGPGPQEKQTG
ncbi:MAG: EAL domain-containing protein [Gammaproteobacteria bacterium]|nr:EAL domain-containing protein [Gammaproteobacteria bacterium]